MSATGRHRKRFSNFTPTSISNCRLWLDCADSNTITLSGSNVTQIRDKSGNNNNAVPSAYTAPVTGTLNSINAVNFSTTTSQMDIAISFAAQAKSCFVVFRHTVDILAQSVKFQNMLGLNTAGRLNFVVDGNTANTYNIAVVPNGFTNIMLYSVSRSSYNFQTPTMISAIQDTTVSNNIVTVNGSNATVVANNAAANYSTASTSLQLSRSVTANSNYVTTWILGEYIQYDGYIAPTQRQQIEGYLAWKWGLVSNLPAGHPYKTAPPFV